MAASEMSPARTVALIIALVLIGPVMFVVSREMSVARRFDQVKLGDDTEPAPVYRP